MKNILNKFKNYKPNKLTCLIYFFIPLFLSILFIDIKEQGDIWFLLNHGKYVLHHGFPNIEPFTIHQNLSFVMQQWLAALIFYLSFIISSKYGLFAICFIINILILYFTYKLCMLITKNNYRYATFFTVVTDIFLIWFRLITPRPQIFTYLFLIITLYIMERFIHNKKTKAIYFLPLISLLQINFHASMYFMLFVFMLPYFITLIKEKDRSVIKLFIICLLMLCVSFINPYSIKNILYVFNSYGNDYINLLIEEMQPLTLTNDAGKLFFIILFLIISFLIFYKQGKLKLRYYLLFIITSLLAFLNKRNIALFIIIIPLLSTYLKTNKISYEKINLTKNNILYFALLIIILIPLTIYFPQSPTSNLETGINKLLTSEKKENIKLYTDFDDGAYAEYRGIKTYIDARAEIFLKSFNHQTDIFYEFYLVHEGKIDFKEFLNKYQFTHLLVKKDSYIYSYLKLNKDYQIFYQQENYVIFQKL